MGYAGELEAAGSQVLRVCHPETWGQLACLGPTTVLRGMAGSVLASGTSYTVKLLYICDIHDHLNSK